MPELHARRRADPNCSLLPPVVALGGGISVEGELSEDSYHNALAAGQLLAAHLVQDEFAITSGMGPIKEFEYPITEAEGMAAIIKHMHPAVSVIKDNSSTNTRENIKRISEIAEVYNISALTLVAVQGQVQRIASQWKSHGKPGVEITPFMSAKVGLAQRARTGALRGISTLAVLGASTPESIEHRLDAVEQGLAPIKNFARVATGTGRKNYGKKSDSK